MKPPIKHPGWSAVIKSLNKAGLTQTDIEERTGISQNFLSDLYLKKRESLRFEAGIKLYALYAEVILRKRVALLEVEHRAT